ncbi:MAG: hypothetical protein A2504_07770 [Bdellovibrionales bacterium RIFOXYD12_FULL_39_22]|nr:MAG: hypothetical protein A2385_11095 [Bdellovibrionales bacterium RIFOXYB1_FULL_39_21]OFZ41272.1 MAG: hypothetical protein A2485_00590 [Bdellovibrionales bacterium RIFOXYC12_FULL_39_17]OFZ45078.1 MAG: hypothetical protein A2404_11390 [Bdellovibrionales bacterium RIFOXYC1_FULL_39_130]OFZ71659.1 MAG: hypothetical protein A2451_03425 [Bdellovibrionales bacterium RIFOXYC2_FULL_39_8]OFZ74462.1 MAG: hypothetical protein A2560_11425 [Bdellovibrionales bacterium RIFOXYD1_FULL_39_84]OFZ92474.1 MAG:
MDYRYLKAFILTAQHLSFSKAATILGVAQSAVSRQIKMLEEGVGEELIIRSSKKVILTDRGLRLFKLSQEFDKMALDLFQKEDNRSIKIGVLHGLLETWLTPIMIAYYKNFSRNISVHIDIQPNLKKALEEGQYDMVFTTENIQSELISSLFIFDERLMLISKKEISPKKINDYRWIIYNDNDNIFRISKKKNSAIIKVDSITTIVNLVKSGVGVAVVPDHVLKNNDSVCCYELPELGISKIYMATLNYASMPNHIKEFSQTINLYQQQHSERKNS